MADNQLELEDVTVASPEPEATITENGINILFEPNTIRN